MRTPAQQPASHANGARSSIQRMAHACGALAGCYSWGRTYEEALKNIKEALELWLEVKKEAGEPIPTDDLGEKLLATDGHG